ncbi:hypothetical protein [Microcystis sp. LE19-59.1C]|nr:hypothetical protein [Microcystis sp. LE19-59.1C]MCZ8046388.1 hypothetical protein [Microcystis sp. LE19-41.2A]
MYETSLPKAINSCNQNHLSGHISITIYGIFLGYPVVSGEVS